MAAAKRGGLGKGLDNLIVPKADTKTKEVKVADDNAIENAVYLELNNVEPNREQPRMKFSEDEILELSDSIKQYGIIQPIVVVKKDDYYMIVSGERRWRAAKLAGLEKIPAIVKDLTAQEVMEISLIENIQREALNPIEEALAYKKLLTEFNLKQDQLAEKVSKSRTAITNAMRLLKLDKRVQQMVIDEMISNGHARALLGIENAEEQVALAQQVFDRKLSVRDTEKLIKNLQNEKKKSPSEKKTISPQMQAIYHDLEEQMKTIFGTKVAIAPKDEKTGRIEVEYYSQDELDRIIDLIRTVRK